MLQFYHDLGYIIYFADGDPELTSLVVLDPQWLIDVFRRIITNDKSQVNRLFWSLGLPICFSVYVYLPKSKHDFAVKCIKIAFFLYSV